MGREIKSKNAAAYFKNLKKDITGYDEFDPYIGDDEAIEMVLMAEKDAQERYDLLQKEFDNYRKRTKNEKSKSVELGRDRTVLEFLPIVDDIQRAISALTDDNPALEGLQLISKNLRNTLKRCEVRKIYALNSKFDPELHEAVSCSPVEVEEQVGCVIEVIQDGYVTNDKVLRYSKVIVGAPKS